MNLNKKILVSIVIPTLNSEKYLQKTIDSIKKQTYSFIEIIIVDSLSDDNTKNIISFNSKYISKVIYEKDHGMYEAINKGFNHANGEIFAYLNSDDLYYEDTISTIVSAFQLNPSIDIIYGNLDFIDQNDNFINNVKYPKFSNFELSTSSFSLIGQPSSFWTKKLYYSVGGFNEKLRMAGDHDFYIKAKKRFNFLKIEKTFAAFRVHTKSLTSKRKDINSYEIKQIRDKYVSYPIILINFASFYVNIKFKIINLFNYYAKLSYYLNHDRSFKK